MFRNWWREFAIRRVLRQLARQHVALVLQPGNVWVIENAVADDETTDAALKTCFMRGWVEPLQNSVPKGKLTPEGRLPEGAMFSEMGPIWKVTDSGWAAIQRSHEWALIAILLAVVGIFVGVVT